eukprot:GILJ01005648.1.p1 GENE.GILJ01005648.1~~GILJ01005648.1.p1  ORF type:complete len:640 (+),score=113.93 GILJ01005648.1:145-1920(+)
MAIMYFVMSNLMGKSTNKNPPVDSTGKAIPPMRNAWSDADSFDLRVYFSESPVFTDFNDAGALQWNEDMLFYSWNAHHTATKNITYIPSKSVLNNGTLYAHAYITKTGFSPDPSADEYVEQNTVYTRKELIQYKLKPKIKIGRNLLTENASVVEEKIQEAAADEGVFVSFWQSIAYLSLVHDFQVFTPGAVPPPADAFVKHVITESDESLYYPIFEWDDFWAMKEHLIQVNETVANGLPLSLTFDLLSFYRFSIYRSMEQSWKTQSSFGMSGAGEGDMDELKRMFTDTNPWLLGLTMVVTLVHMAFDFFAFKNDIAFWKNNKSMEGLSAQSIFLSAACQTVIFLYLLDSETSYVILFSAGIGLLIEYWKVTKAAKFSRLDHFPFISFQYEVKYSESPTRKYDRDAMRYMSWVLYPLVIGYSIYSLYEHEHKSWYSWLLGSLVGTVYTFGFIMMTPQLYINYKLKSVEHLPWRVMVYKALNTFIDDLFAFIIKMPTLHRLSCFRDDIIFFIYLYQRWIYKVDKKRVGENGLSGEDYDRIRAGQPLEPVQPTEADRPTEEETTEARVASEVMPESSQPSAAGTASQRKSRRAK